jgi:peroxiredoxin
MDNLYKEFSIMRLYTLIPLITLLLTGCGDKQSSAEVANYSKAAAKYLEKSKEAMKKMAPEDLAIMKKAGDDLARTMPKPGLNIGDKAPDFSLPDPDGNLVTLSDSLEKGHVVLVFYRGAWCPFCNMHLAVLNQSLAEIKRNGGQLLTVTPQKPDKSAAQIKKAGYPFPVLSDLDSSVMKAYNLYFEMDPQLVSVYNKLKLDIAEYNGEGRYVLPVPGTFIIDKNGIIRAQHATTDYKERMEPADIISELKKLNAAANVPL